jgi:FkbM family methyltransferase
MSPFELHRHIPLIRRPFWQRDRALAERDFALTQLAQAELEKQEAVRLLNKATERLDAATQERSRLEGALSGKPKSHCRAFELPPEFQAVSIAGHEGKIFHLVVDGVNPRTYDRWVIDCKYYSDIARLLIQLLQGEGTLIDLGANIGTISIPVGMTGTRVLAVEMLPHNTMKLGLAALLNRLGHFRIIQSAVTDNNGIVGYIGDEAWAQVSAEKMTRQAVGLRLDTILDLIELDSPSFLKEPIAMKIDIEGHELQALHGAEQVLREYRPTFIFESIQVATDRPERAMFLKEFVSSTGYALYLLRGTVLSPHLKGDPQISPVSDILAVPHETCAETLARLTSYSVRPLSRQEQLDWLQEVRASDEQFSEHVATVRTMLSLN